MVEGSWVCGRRKRGVNVNKGEIITYFILYVYLRSLIDKNVPKLNVEETEHDNFLHFMTMVNPKDF